MTDKKIIEIFIKNTDEIETKIKIAKSIINSARAKVKSDILDVFYESFNPQEKNYKSKYVLEKEVWVFALEKRNWNWLDFEVSNEIATLRIFHNPMSNYIDLIHVLLYTGINKKDVEINDEIFGYYKLNEMLFNF